MSEAGRHGCRTMSAARFDAFSAARALEAVGVERSQAEAIASAIGNHAELATKADISMLESRLEQRMSALEARMYRALWIQGGAIVAIVTALKLLD